MRKRPHYLWLSACVIVAFGCKPTSSSTVTMGRELYLGNGCASCHGPNGHGDGPVGKTLNTPPRDFRDITAFKNGADAAAIAGTIRRGIGDATQMPAFGHLNESERLSLALYVVSVRDSIHPIHRTP